MATEAKKPYVKRLGEFGFDKKPYRHGLPTRIHELTKIHANMVRHLDGKELHNILKPMFEEKEFSFRSLPHPFRTSLNNEQMKYLHAQGGTTLKKESAESFMRLMKKREIYDKYHEIKDAHAFEALHTPEMQTEFIHAIHKMEEMNLAHNEIKLTDVYPFMEKPRKKAAE